MHRVDYYFRQKVTEAELDKGFDYTEQAIWNLALDPDLVGIMSGLTVAQQGVPNMTVAIAAGVAYDQLGRRLRVPAPQNLNCAVDYNNVATAVAAPGNEKWLSVFLGFKRDLSDPRTDGNSLPVYFERAESFELRVVQGAEAAAGAATRPALDSGRLLLADVKLAHNQTSVVTANLSTTRRQDVFVVAGSPRALAKGTMKGALTDLLGWYNAHVAGSDKHAAAHVDYAGGGAWKDGTTNPATSVELQLDKIVADLVHANGAKRIGQAALPALADATVIDEGSLGENLRVLVDYLGDATGHALIGADAVAGVPTSLSPGTLASQIDALLSAVNARGYRVFRHDFALGGGMVEYDVTHASIPAGATFDLLLASFDDGADVKNVSNLLYQKATGQITANVGTNSAGTLRVIGLIVP